MAVDIVKDYSWTSIPKNSGYRDEAPCAFVRAFELEYSQLQQFVAGYINLATPVIESGVQNVRNAVADTKAGKALGATKAPPKKAFNSMDFYRNLYQSNKPIESYNFPFFNDNIRGFSNAYDDTFSSISQRGGKFMGAGLVDKLTPLGEELAFGGAAGFDQIKGIYESAKLGAEGAGEDASMGEKIRAGFKGAGSFAARAPDARAPGSYIETPKMYQYDMTDAPLTVNFVLANTIDEEDAGRNTAFIRQFTAINRPRRKGPIAITFPAIYHVEVPGLRYIEWAYLSNFSIGLIGTRRKINNQVIPEAYSCSFEFTSLTIEAANFMDELDNAGGGDFDAFDEGADTRGLAEILEENPNAVPDFGTEAFYNKYPDQRPRGGAAPGGGSGETRIPASDLPEFNRPLSDFGGPGNLLD